MRREGGKARGDNGREEEGDNGWEGGGGICGLMQRRFEVIFRSFVKHVEGRLEKKNLLNIRLNKHFKNIVVIRDLHKRTILFNSCLVFILSLF